jgi:hypothetical protein
VSRGGPQLYVTLRTNNALVRGSEAQHICRQVGAEPTWSDYGRGWVIPADKAHDVLAYAQSSHMLAVVTDETPPSTEEVAS